MTFDMTQGKDPLYEVRLYDWNVDDRYLFSDYTSASNMFIDLVLMYRSSKSGTPIIVINDVITSERIKRNE